MTNDYRDVNAYRELSRRQMTAIVSNTDLFQCLNVTGE